jgi:hypothetical protein
MADDDGGGIDPSARPSLAEVLQVPGTRQAMVRGIVDGLTDDDLARERPPMPDHPGETVTVRRCLKVIMNEECEHRRYAVRDLTVLESPVSSG